MLKGKLLQFDSDRYVQEGGPHINYISFRDDIHVMVSYKSCRQIDKATFWRYDGGKWKIDPYFVADVERDVCTFLTSSTKFKRYGHIVNALFERDMGKFKRYSPFDSFEWIKRGAVPVFTPTKVLCVRASSIDTEPNYPPKYNNFWSIATELSLYPSPTPVFDKFLEDVTGGDSELARTLVEIIGVCMTPLKLQAAFYFLVGDGANGKSTFQNIIKLLLGEENVTFLSLHDLAPQTIELLQGSLANLSGETSSLRKLEGSILKAVSDGNECVANPKYREPYKVVPMAKLIFAMNKLPNTVDLSDGFWRRCYVVPFQMKITNQDHNFIRKIEPELPGIAQKALMGLQDVVRRGGYVLRSKKVVRATALYRDSASSVLEFTRQLRETPLDEFLNELGLPSLRSEITTTNEATLKVRAKTLYKMFSCWASLAGHRGLGRLEFYQQFEETVDGYSKVLLHGKQKGYEIRRTK